MYGWIWRQLPGGRLAKAAASLLLMAAAVVVLFRGVFPYVEPRLPWNDSVVGTSPTEPTSPPTPQPATSGASP